MIFHKYSSERRGVSKHTSTPLPPTREHFVEITSWNADRSSIVRCVLEFGLLLCTRPEVLRRSDSYTRKGRHRQSTYGGGRLEINPAGCPSVRVATSPVLGAKHYHSSDLLRRVKCPTVQMYARTAISAICTDSAERRSYSTARFVVSSLRQLSRPSACIFHAPMPCRHTSQHPKRGGRVGQLARLLPRSQCVAPNPSCVNHGTFFSATARLCGLSSRHVRPACRRG